MLTSDDLLTTLKRLGEGIQRLETGQQRLEIYTIVCFQPQKSKRWNAKQAE